MKIQVTLWLAMLLAANSNTQASSIVDVSSCTSGRILKDEVGNEICDEVDIRIDATDNDDDLDSASSFSESSYEAGIPAPLSQVDEAGSDIGEAQIIDPRYMDDIVARIATAREYLQKEVQVDAKYDLVRDMCRNKNNNCAFWAVLGECENNPAYMHTNCAPVCNTCEMLHVDTRCPLDPDAPNALEPGDVNKLFERIATDPWYQQYQPVVLSRPDYLPGDTAENATYKIGLWMILFENAISDEEAERMIELGGLRGYERSKDVGDEREDGTFDSYTNDGRTSTNAWCVDDCFEDPVARRLMDRVENITGIPETNSENFQLLRYEHNQFYQTHNDLIPYQKNRPCGVRILTFYFYLSDVEEGGGTNFPRNHNLTVQPRRGRAVLWPSVLNEDPHKKDRRADHQALPVIKGTKYGANAWIHQRDFKTPNKRGC